MKEAKDLLLLTVSEYPSKPRQPEVLEETSNYQFLRFMLSVKETSPFLIY